MKKKHYKSTAASNADKGSAFPALVAQGKALAISLGAVAVLLFVAALYAYSQDNPDKYLSVLSMVIVFVGAFVCGFAAAKLLRERIALVGLSAGAMYVFFLLIMRLFMRAGGYGFWQSCAVYLGLIGAGIVGALIGGKNPGRKKSRRTEYKKISE